MLNSIQLNCKQKEGLVVIKYIINKKIQQVNLNPTKQGMTITMLYLVWKKGSSWSKNKFGAAETKQAEGLRVEIELQMMLMITMVVEYNIAFCKESANYAKGFWTATFFSV